MHRRFVYASIFALVVLAAGVLAARQLDVAIRGYCPVAYPLAGQPSKGDARFVTTIDGRTYLLTNAMVKEMFDKDPARFIPAYRGYCVVGVAQGVKLEVDPTQFLIEGGRTYLFSSTAAKQAFEADKAGTIKAADANWPTVQNLRVTRRSQ